MRCLAQRALRDVEHGAERLGRHALLHRRQEIDAFGGVERRQEPMQVVGEVVGDEERERGVEPSQRGAARSRAAVGDEPGQVAQVGNGFQMVLVLGGDARRAAGANAFQRRVTEPPLIPTACRHCRKASIQRS